MDVVPGRNVLALPYRTLVSYIENRLPLPDLNPSFYHAAAILLSILFAYAPVPWLRAAIIAVVLVTDVLDGATVRRYDKYNSRAQRGGYVIDVVTDRMSEALIFSAAALTALGAAFFLLWILNCVLTLYSVYANKHWSLPLRFSYMLVLIAPTM